MTPSLDTILADYECDVQVLTKLAQWYNHCLFDNEFALRYATEERKLTSETIDRFCIGYAPSTEETETFLQANYIDHDTLIRTGNWHEKDGLAFDKLQDRLVFPIYDFMGNVLAFSGRALFDGMSKYFNSPTSLVYKKSLVLFGFYQALSAIRKQDFVILVEGNIDVCMMHQCGFENVIAPNGTALCAEHLLMLQHFTPNLVCCFDSDTAGKTAATKAKKLCSDYGFTYRNIELELATAKDPDEFLKKFGADEFYKLLEVALS